ncbi:MAG: MraY family glycosyltransferase [Bacilli bacterium]
MNQDTISNLILMIFIPFIFVVATIPFFKKIAVQINAIDIPRNRHIHDKPIPKLGGLAIFGGFLLGYMIFGTHSSTMNAILIGSFIILITGLIDDITELKAITQLMGQLVAACVIVFYGNILLSDISAFGIYIDFNIFSYPLTIFFILGCINCINFIDGIDGLSGGISSIYFLTIGIIAVIQGKTGLDFVLTFVMLGSVLGFLVYNFYPASIFAGNSGSMFMGFIISVIALLGFKNVTMTSLIIPLFVLAIPILDTAFAIIRRLLKGQRPFDADKFHIHHQFLNISHSQKTTVLLIYGIDLLFAASSILYVTKENNTLSYIIYTILLLIFIILVLKTNILIDKNYIKEKMDNKLRRK